MANCIILYGDHILPCLHKSAGPFRIATELRNNGYTVQTLDVSGIHSNDPILFKLVDHFINTDTFWVGISGTFLFNILGTQFKKFKDLTADNKEVSDNLKIFMDACRKKNPNIKFIYGGSKKYQLTNLGFYTFLGYADKEIIEFTRWCNDPKYIPKLKRLGKVITCSEYDDFYKSDIKFCDEDLILPGECLPLEIARGCIFKCDFCAFPLNGKTKGEWIRKPEVIKNELIYNWEKFGVDTYNFADDTYNDSIDKIRLLHDEVFTKLPFKMKFTSYIRLDLVMKFPESIELLKNSGLESAVTGIETLNFKSAKTIGKGVDPMKQIDFVAKLKTDQWKDILISSGFILGLPHDTTKDLEFAEKFFLSKDNPLDHWMINPLGIFPPSDTDHINWYSSIDKNHEKYGYQLEGDPHIGGQWVPWTHKENGTNWKQCDEIAKRILTTSATSLPNYKVGGNFYWGRLNMGVPRKDLFNLSWKEVHSKYNIDTLKSNIKKTYYSKFNNLIESNALTTVNYKKSS